jgi:hypothetical protein
MTYGIWLVCFALSIADGVEQEEILSSEQSERTISHRANVVSELSAKSTDAVAEAQDRGHKYHQSRDADHYTITRS